MTDSSVLGGVIDDVKQYAQTPTGAAVLTGVGATLLGGAGYAAHEGIERLQRRRATKKRATKKPRAAKKTTKRAAKARKHKPRARGGVHNGRRVLIAKNGTRYIKLKSGKVRFIK